MTTQTKQTLSHLDWLESEAIHIMREVAGQCSNPVLLFSGGKDSICMLRIAEKAFRPGKFPFPLMHIDTGHNYQEVIDFRDKRAAELGERLPPPHDFDDAAWVGARYTELLPIPLLAKQKLLELDDPISRLEILQKYLREHGLLPNIA